VVGPARSRDIVATIQAEQDEIIRAPLSTGSSRWCRAAPVRGKTAVGLHRAAFLLYEHRLTLEERRVLVVGPNRVFLRYISEVLPALGETAVVQTTIDGLLGARHPVRAREDVEVERLKGDARMAEVLRRALDGMIRPPVEDTELTLPWGRARLTSTDIAESLAAARSRALDFTAAREVFRTLLARRAEALLLQQFRGEAPAGSDFIADARADDGFRRLVNRTWPAASARTLLRRVLGNRRALAAAADGLLDRSEQTLLHRPPTKKVDDEPWTAADIPLLDEAEALVSGVRVTYGHIVVDEAQDLSAMALRMLARRSPDRSMTVLGDLAQSTAPAGQEHWDDVARHLGSPERHVVAELEIGYRVPAPILDFASRLLPIAAPHIVPSRSIRLAGDEPWVTAVDPEDLLAAVAARARLLADEWRSIGVVSPASLTDIVLAALSAAGLDAAAAERGGLDRKVAVLDPPTAKGLEFDAVVVVEPARFLVEESLGARLLYIAMTRCVQHLSVLHAEPLPEPLQAVGS
jgi:DNA helicase IV